MLRKIFLSNAVINSAIILNAVVIFLMAFPSLSQNTTLQYLEWGFTLFFTIEIIVKMSLWGSRTYLADGFNKFDFFIVLASLPSLVTPFIPFNTLAPFTILRLLRLVCLARLLAFIPNMGQLIRGLRRAFKASIFVLLACFLYNFILSVISCQLFHEVSPKYFGNPLISFYTTFQLFTVEGWNEISDEIAKSTEEGLYLFLARCYFMFVVLSGGIFGLSIANAVFVDEMTIDNNIVLEEKVDQLKSQIDRIEASIESLKKD